MHVFKLVLSPTCRRLYDLQRRECETSELRDVIAISYAWGSLPHTEAFRFTSDLAVQLGTEWNHDAFLTELATLSQDAWLWLDQLSLHQSNATTTELNISIPTVFKTARVLVLLPGQPCAKRDGSVDDAFENWWRDGHTRKPSSLVVERLVGHGRQCKTNCIGGIDVWLKRVWPWQEFAYARRIQVRFAAGMPRASRDSAVTNDVMTLLRQQVLDKNVRLHVLEEHEQSERSLRGREVEFGDFDEPTGQAMLHYMSNYVEQNRICTKDTDLVSAVAPAIGATANAKGSLVEGVTKLIRHIERETRTIFVGPLPCGILDSSDGSLRAHARTFEGLNDLSNVGKISFLHGTHFANDDLLANVDDHIRVETLLTESDRSDDFDIRSFLYALSLSQVRMLARWLASWEPQSQRDGSGIFDEALQFMATLFASSQATIDGPFQIILYSPFMIPNP